MGLLIKKLQRQSEYLDSLQERPNVEKQAPSPSAAEGICHCGEWQTFPCDPNRKCLTCHTQSICQDCGGCRWCWWLGVTGQVRAMEIEAGWDEMEMPF